MTTIPKGNSLAVDDILERYANILEIVEEELHDFNVQTQPTTPDCPAGLKSGITFDQQSSAPIAPSDLTVLHPTTLGQLYSYWVAWTNYYETLLGNSKTKVDIITERIKVVEAALECHYREELGIPVDHLSAKVRTDRRYVEWNIELSRAKQFARGVDAQHSSFKRTANNISREITRRGEEGERERAGGGGRARSEDQAAWTPSWGSRSAQGRD